jgi:dipeptidyl aminopeptidase/acylaminoacyl peptidase
VVRALGYGSWKSPISASMVASGGVSFERPILLDGDNIYWVESRPNEGGRSVIVRWSPRTGTVDVTTPSFNSRTRVHEYGGGAYTVDSGIVVFSNFDDQQLYRKEVGTEPKSLTSEKTLRYADMLVDSRRKRIICVVEDHSGTKAANSLIAILMDGSIQKLISGNDFYSSPCLSPDGSRLAWLTWNHPHMPWDAAELWVGGIEEDGSVNNISRVAGGYNESVCHPQFSPDGTLYFVSERTGWWNLYRLRDSRVQSLHKMNAEFGVPLWTFGTSTYGFTSNEQIICTYVKDGRSFLASLDTRILRLEKIDVPYTSIDSVRVSPRHVVFVGGSQTEPRAIVSYDLKIRKAEVLRRSIGVSVDSGYISEPRPIRFTTSNGLAAHAYFYLPRNRDFRAPLDERPPLIVISHGGPTGSTSGTLNLSTQYWTSRGFSVADVDYGGSTGYGQDYRKRLDGKWGIVDVDDCVNCARYLAKNGEIDENRTIIRGGSAGGYTTLAALTFRDFFKAGASYYGVGDLETLARDTHKFESRYLDGLVGPYPQRRDIYLERSPINFTDRLSCPVIFFQGSEDKVVPPNQAETMVNALRKNGVTVAYILFKKEQHGFRRAENIKRALEAELYFYSRVFGFELAEPVEQVTIENLK